MKMSSEKADINHSPHPSIMRRDSTKSLRFVESSCTVIPNFTHNDFEEEEKWWKLAWWEPEERWNWSQYCTLTSLHGLKYIAEPKRHMCERIFWIIAFILSCLAGVYLIHSVWLKYVQSPVVITMQPYQTFVEQIPFPAITICNMNKVLKSKALQYMSETMGPEDDPKTAEAWRNVYYLDHVCSSSNKPFSTTFNYTSSQGSVHPHVLHVALSKINATDREVEDVAAFLQKASQPCTDMIKLCLWQGDIYNCSDLFRPIETKFGKCCSFNMIPQTLLHRFRNDPRDPEEHVNLWNEWNVAEDGFVQNTDSSTTKKFPRRQNRAGREGGFSFLVDPDLEEYFCVGSDSTGFRLTTHLPNETPRVENFGMAIRPNSEHFVSVRPEVTIADSTLSEIPIGKRNCYMEGERELTYYNYYTAWNCFDECIANLTYEKCQCVRYYMPRDDKREICGPSKFSCAEAVKKESFVSGVKKICQQCLPTCNEIRYFSHSSSTPFRKRNDLWLNEYNISTSWAHSNISIVHVYFGQDSTYARVRSQLYGLTDLIANFGGLMSLAMGFSGISLLEIIYFFTIRLWFRRKRRLMLKRQEEARKAAERDREKALAYLGIGRRRSSVDSLNQHNLGKPVVLRNSTKDDQDQNENSY